nr:MAG: polyprotein [Posavirus sp.]
MYLIRSSTSFNKYNRVGGLVPLHIFSDAGATRNLNGVTNLGLSSPTSTQSVMGSCNIEKITETPRRKAKVDLSQMSQISDNENCVGVIVPAPICEESGVAYPNQISTQSVMGSCNIEKITETPCRKANPDLSQMSQISDNQNCAGVIVPAPICEESGVAYFNQINEKKEKSMTVEDDERVLLSDGDVLVTIEKSKREVEKKKMVEQKIWREEVQKGVLLIHGGPYDGEFIVTFPNGSRKQMTYNPFAAGVGVKQQEEEKKKKTRVGFVTAASVDPKTIKINGKTIDVTVDVQKVKALKYAERKYDPKEKKMAKNPAVADNSVRAEIAKEQGIRKDQVPRPDKATTRLRKGKRGRQGEKRRIIAEQRKENYSKSRRAKTQERKKKQINLATYAIVKKLSQKMVERRNKDGKQLPPMLRWREMIDLMEGLTNIEDMEYRGVPSAKNLEKWKNGNVLSYVMHNLNDPKRLRAALVYYLQVYNIPKARYFDITRLSKRAAAKQMVITCFTVLEYASDPFVDLLCEYEMFCSLEGYDLNSKSVAIFCKSKGEEKPKNPEVVAEMKAAGLMNADGTYADFEDEELAAEQQMDEMIAAGQACSQEEPPEDPVRDPDEVDTADQACSHEELPKDPSEDPYFQEKMDSVMKDCYTMLEAVNDNALMSAVQAHGPVEFVMKGLSRLIVNPVKSLINYLQEQLLNFVGDALDRVLETIKKAFNNLGLDWLWSTFLAMYAMIREAAEAVVNKIKTLLALNAAKDVVVTIVICFTVYVLYKIFRTMWSEERAAKLIYGPATFANASPASYVMPIVALITTIVPAGNYVSKFLATYKNLMASKDAVNSVDTLLSWMLPQSILSAITNNPADSEFAMLTAGYNTIISFGNCAEVLLDPYVVSYIDSYLSQCQDFLVKYRSDKSCSTVSMYYRDVSKIARDVTRHVTTAGMRMEPVCIRFYGASGIGKSKAVGRMIADFGYKPHQFQNISIGAKTFEQLTGCERVIIFDEIYANETYRVETATRFKDIVNTMPTHVNGSDIVGIESNKHSSLAPDIVFCTSEQLLYPSVNSGIDLQSLYNREHFRFRITSTKDEMAKYGLDTNHKDIELDKEVEAHLPWLKFVEVRHTKTNGFVDGDTFTYDEVKDAIVAEVRRRKRIFATRKVVDKKHDVPSQVFTDLLSHNYNSLNVVPPKNSDIEEKYRALVNLAAVEIQDELPKLQAKGLFTKKKSKTGTCAMCETNACLDHHDFCIDTVTHHLTLEGEDHSGDEGYALQLSLAKHTYRYVEDVQEGEVKQLDYSKMGCEMLGAAIDEADVKLISARRKYLAYYNEARRARNTYFMKAAGFEDEAAVSDAVKTVGSLALGVAALGGFYTLFKWLLGSKQPKYVAETYDVRIRRAQRKARPIVAEAHQNSMKVNYTTLRIDRHNNASDSVFDVRCIYVGNDRYVTYAHWIPLNNEALDTFSYSLVYGDSTVPLQERPKFYTTSADNFMDVCVFRAPTSLSPANYFKNLPKTQNSVLSRASSTLVCLPDTRGRYHPEVIDCSYQGYDTQTMTPRLFTAENVLSIPYPSYAGDCGTALLDEANNVVGMLTAGTITDASASMFQVLSKELVDTLCPVYESHGPAIWKDPATYPTCRGSRLHATSLKPYCEEAAGTKFYKPPMSASTSPIQVDPRDSFIQRLNQCDNDSKCDPNLIQRAKADMIHQWTLEDRGYPTTSLEDAVKGYRHLNSLDLDTSMAWPLALETHDPALSGKRAFIRIVNDEVVTTELFNKRLQQVTDYITKGTPCPFYTVCAFKDEPLKESKYLENRPRVIMPSDAVLNVYMRSRLAPLLSDFYDFQKNHNMAIGVNIESVDAELMLRHLKYYERKNRLVDADYSAFDMTIPRQYLEAAYDVLEKIVAHSKLMSAEEFHRYATINLNPVIYFDGVRLEPRSLNTSGNLFTTIVNCVVNELYLRSAFYHYHPDAVFDEHISCLFYGDDMLYSVGPDVDLTFPMYRDFCKTIGLKVTPGNKSDEVHDYLTLDQVTFLSHNFCDTPYGHMGALSLSHFYKALSYSFDRDICVDALESLVRAIAAFPEPIFAKTVSWLRSISPIKVPYNVGSRDMLLLKLYNSSAVVNSLPRAFMPFVRDHDELEDETTESVPRDLSSVPEDPVEMYDAASAPFQVAHFNWDGSQTRGTELWSCQMPCLPSVQTLASMPLYTTYFSNFHCAVTFKMTASRFSRGLLVAYLEPLGSKTAGRVLDYRDMLTVPHVFLTPMNSDNAELVQGFISPRNLYQNALLFNRTEFSGWLHIAVFSPYSDDQTNPQNASITVFARYIDMKAFQARRFTISAAGIAKELCKTVERTARLAGTVADLVGLDAPEQVGQPQVVTQRYMPLSNVDGVRDTNELRENEAAFDGRARQSIFLGADMLLGDLISRPFLLDSFLWTADKDCGHILNVIHLNCVPGVKSADGVLPAPVSFLNLATFWHCDFALTFKFVKNAFSTGRLRITTVYGAMPPAAADIPYYKGDLINVDATTDAYSFTFSYLALTDYLRTFEGWKRLEDVPEDYELGTVTTSVINPIHAIEGVSASCDVLIICEMINVDTRVPRPVPFIEAAGFGYFLHNAIKMRTAKYRPDGHQAVYYIKSRYAAVNIKIPADWVTVKDIGNGFICSLHNYIEATGIVTKMDKTVPCHTTFASFYLYRYDELIGICCPDDVYTSDDLLFFKTELKSLPAPKPVISVSEVGEYRSALLGPVVAYAFSEYWCENVLWFRTHAMCGAKGDCGSPLHLYKDGQLYWVGSLQLVGSDTCSSFIGYCVLRNPFKKWTDSVNTMMLMNVYGINVSDRLPPGFPTSEDNTFFSTALGVDDMGEEEGGFASDEDDEEDEMVGSQFAYRLTDLTDFIRRGIVLNGFSKSWTEADKKGVVTTVFPVEPHFGLEQYFRAWSGSIHYRIVNLGSQSTPIRVTFYPGGSGADVMTFSGLFSTDVASVAGKPLPTAIPAPTIARPPLELAYRVCASNEYIDFAIPFQTMFHFIELHNYVQTAPLGYVAVQGLNENCQVYTYAGDDFSYGFFYPFSQKVTVSKTVGWCGLYP